jgi:predicted XRE-type DNA-binding protein
MNKASHITTGDILDDLGFSRSEASALKIKTSIFEAILAQIDRRGFTQRQLWTCWMSTSRMLAISCMAGSAR